MLDWSDLAYTLALGRAGTLSAAARELRVNHVTIARRVARLDEALGVKLFDKTADGYRLTAAGQIVFDEAHAVEQRLARMQLSLQRFASPAAGPVRISAIDTFFSEVLIERLPQFRDRYPDIEVTLMVAAGYSDLSRKEAEIAVRSPKPKQPNLICRRAFRVGNGLYAARRYVERFGLPRDLGDASGHHLVRYAAELDWVPEERWLDKHVRGARCPARATSPDQQLDLVRRGVGFGFIECRSGDADPELVRVPGTPVMRFTYWLTVHEEAYAAPRVRIVLDWLGEVAREVQGDYPG